MSPQLEQVAREDQGSCGRLTVDTSAVVFDEHPLSFWMIVHTSDLIETIARWSLARRCFLHLAHAQT